MVQPPLVGATITVQLAGLLSLLEPVPALATIIIGRSAYYHLTGIGLLSLRSVCETAYGMTNMKTYQLIIGIQNGIQKRKTPLKWRYYSLLGGVDGTRTRDPRRDRPVF